MCMRKTLSAAGLVLALLGGSAVPAGAAARQWKVSYVSPDTGYDDFGLYSVAATGAGDAWAVGAKRQGPDGANAFLHWDGATWGDVVLPGNETAVQAVDGDAPDDVWALGTKQGVGTAWHWNGRKWVVSSTFNGYDVGDVAVVGVNDVWAVGGNEGDSAASALHWDGRKWSKVPMPGIAFKIAAVGKDDLWAVGEGPGSEPYAAHWDGKAWKASTLPGGDVSGYFNDVVATGGENVWAVGRVYSDATGTYGPLLMHWDGASWARVAATGDIAMRAASDGAGGLWYSTDAATFVHRTSGVTTTYDAPVPATRPGVDIRDIANIPGTGKVLAVGQAQPAEGDDSSDALVEQYGP